MPSQAFRKRLVKSKCQTQEEKARFDTRLTKEQKRMFEKAAQLGGYRSLTDFVVLTVQEKAKEIINEYDQIIASRRDSELFFEALLAPPKANANLVRAVAEYEKEKLDA